MKFQILATACLFAYAILSIANAANQLQRSEGLVYAARSRIIRRLRDVVRELDGEVE